MPANLQGMWNNNIDGPWRVDYHNNINLQMNYWPATCTNMLECYQPFIDYVRGLVKPGERTAQAYYGARGWTAEVSTNEYCLSTDLVKYDIARFGGSQGVYIPGNYIDSSYTQDNILFFDWEEEKGTTIKRCPYDVVKENILKIADVGSYYESDGVEGALQEIGSTLNGLKELLADI
jgi:hypothetical protein